MKHLRPWTCGVEESRLYDVNPMSDVVIEIALCQPVFISKKAFYVINVYKWLLFLVLPTLWNLDAYLVIVGKSEKDFYLHLIASTDNILSDPH